MIKKISSNSKNLDKYKLIIRYLDKNLVLFISLIIDFNLNV